MMLYAFLKISASSHILFGFDWIYSFVDIAIFTFRSVSAWNCLFTTTFRAFGAYSHFP